VSKGTEKFASYEQGAHEGRGKMSEFRTSPIPGSGSQERGKKSFWGVGLRGEGEVEEPKKRDSNNWKGNI